MVRLRILSGKSPGAEWTARRYPITIGRSRKSDLCLEENGVWDDHLKLELRGQGFSLATAPNALASVNGQPVQSTILRNGDVIEIGSVKLQFWLAESRQRGLRLREGLTWIAIAAICLGQIGLIYWLLR